MRLGAHLPASSAPGRTARARLRVAPLVLGLLVGSGLTGCTPDGQTAGGAGAIDWTPDCEFRGYPCTWGEVEEEALTRSDLLGELASLMMTGGSDADEIASFLAEDSAVAEIEVYGSRVRFRVDGGRPGWILPPDELDHHRADPAEPDPGGQAEVALGAPAVPRWGSPQPPPERPQSASLGHLRRWLSPAELLASTTAPQSGNVPRQGIAAREPGNGKKALLLSPFAWQWMGRVSDPAFDSLRGVRDYRSEEGGSVVYHADSDSLADEAPGQGPHRWTDNVLLDDFLHWNEYNVVVLVTHGWIWKCDPGTRQASVPPPGRRRPGDRSNWTVYDRHWEEAWARDRDPDDPTTSVNEFEYCPVVWAGRAKRADYGGYPGVEVAYFAPVLDFGEEQPEEPDTRYPSGSWDRVGYDRPSHPGLTREEAAWCRAEIDRGVENPTTAGGRKPCTLPRWRYRRRMVGLTMPFFRDRYPKGLDHTIAFVAACFSGFNYYLLDHLTGFDQGPGNENVAAFGFSTLGNYQRDYATAIPKMISLLDSGYHASKILNEMRLVSPQLVGRAFGSPGSGAAAAHGRDVVELIVPGARTEVEDGASIRVRGTPGDGVPDSLELRATVIGVSDREALEEIRMRVAEVESRSSPDWMVPTKETDKVGAFEAPIPVPLGRDFEDGEVVDLEIQAELPGGELTRWVYEDLVLSNCFWTASISGPGLSRSVAASWGNVSTDESARIMTMVPHTVVLDEDPQPEPPWTVIDLVSVGSYAGLSDPRAMEEVTGLKLMIPGVRSGEVGAYSRVWGSLGLGATTHFGNADYLRRDLIGLPEGSGIGHVLTTSVTLTRNDSLRVEGTFEGRFLDRERFQALDIYEQHPLGVGIHPIRGAEITATGEFSVMRDGSCRPRAGVSRMRSR
jgi:hypothetical protein